MDDHRSQEEQARAIDEDNMRAAYRNLFSSDVGQFVLCDMLVDLGFFSVAETPEGLALQNYAKLLLNKMEIWRAHNAPALVEAMLSIPIKPK